ncbi:hypothetical protein RhiirA5_437671, partial [Rhizophagus irregularis]
MFNFTNFFSNNVNIIVTVKKILDDPISITDAKVARLNLTDNLLKVRQELEVSGIVDNTLLFSRKYLDNINDDKTYGFADIALEKEENYLLNEIIDKNGNILYLKQCSTPDWKCLNGLCKLDYGCAMTSDGIKKAENRAFEMQNCELVEIGGISIGNMENEGVNSENISSYHFTEYGKVSLKFDHHLKPTQEFIKVVEGAIKSKDPVKEIKQITEQYGQFIPTEVILGGRAYFNEHITSTGCFAGNSKGIAMNANAGGILGANAASSFNYSKEKSTYYKSNCTKLIGGKQPDNIENFDEAAWAKSLKDYKSWDSIELQNPTSIFKLLSYDLRKQIIESVGKRIHHLDFVDFSYCLDEFGKPKIFEFKD